jgi:hypothetical protein
MYTRPLTLLLLLLGVLVVTAWLLLGPAAAATGSKGVAGTEGM